MEFKNPIKLDVVSFVSNIFFSCQSGKTKDKKCPKCPFATKHNSSLNKHIKVVHEEVKDKKCPKCSITCKTKAILLSHINFNHGCVKADSAFKCDKCPYVTNFKHHIKRHHKVAHGNQVKTINVHNVTLQLLGVAT